MPDDARGTWGHFPDDERPERLSASDPATCYYDEAVTVTKEDWDRVRKMLSTRMPNGKAVHVSSDGWMSAADITRAEARLRFLEAVAQGGDCVSSTTTIKAAPDKPEQRGHPVWLWVWEPAAGIPSTRVAAFADTGGCSCVEVVVPIGWGMASSEKLGACLRNTFGTEITANTVLNLATERMDGFSIKEKE